MNILICLNTADIRDESNLYPAAESVISIHKINPNQFRLPLWLVLHCYFFAIITILYLIRCCIKAQTIFMLFLNAVIYMCYVVSLFVLGILANYI